MPDDRSLPLDHEPLNRAERRAARFHQRTGRPDPHAVTAPALGEQPAAAESGGHAEASATTGSGNPTDRTGAGTGGATESATRKPRHEGSHVGVTPKG